MYSSCFSFLPVFASNTYLEAMPEGQREGVAAVAVDMWEPSQNALESLLPEADIIYASFIWQDTLERR